MKNILAVETSCDDSSVAIVREDGFVVFNEVENQLSLHKPYGGVVPELASRNHGQRLLPLIEKALSNSGYNWKNIDVLGVTNRPGLIGSLIVGLTTVKTLSILLEKPYVAVNHIEGHILSPFLWDSQNPFSALKFPFLALIVSGGHTSLFLAKTFGEYYPLAHTVDDAAGETLDKVARFLGLHYPNGAEMDRISYSTPADRRYIFPKVVLKQQSLNFSFSGLKTSAIQLIQKTHLSSHPEQIPFFCADFQQALVEHLIERLNQAIQKYPSIPSVVIAGGVSANSRLRKASKEWAKKNHKNIFLPPLKYCTDNAGMIGFAGLKWFKQEKTASQSENSYSHALEGDFTQP